MFVFNCPNPLCCIFGTSKISQLLTLNSKSVFELLYEASKAISSEIELQKVVQRVTDIGTELSGAQFGAFFYNVINPKGESYFLYTISGVEKEAFSKFPMPRNTKIFEPTFVALGTVRYDDVTKQPHYGKNPPYHGMPKGHLPVKSYLAVPVVSPFTKEAIGGLFFGHAEAGVFTEESEKLIEGVAVQAAIAIINARLFEEKKQTEAKLVQQREQYRSIFNATSDSAIIYNEEGTIVEVNPSACQIFGYDYDELIGKQADILFQTPADFAVLKEIALSGREYSGVNPRVKKDGTQFQAEFKGVRFLYNDAPHVLSIVKDLTSEKQTKEALYESEKLSEVITSVSPVALWMTNKDGETIYINKTWLDWVGGSTEKHLEYGWLNNIIPEDKERLMEEFKASFDQRKIFTMDFRIKRRNGETRWCTSYGGPYFDRDSSFGGFAGSVTDITDAKEAEEKLESRNTLINTIANNTRQALFLMDAKQVCTYMNPAAEQMTGFTLEEVREKPLHYYIHHTHPDGTHFPIEECAIDRALPTKAQTGGEEVFIHKDGSFYPVAFTASPIVENGIPTGTVIEARNTTEERKIQEELRNKEKMALEMLEAKVRERTGELESKNYELLRFTSVASHDLKEPVRKISVYGSRLKELLETTQDQKLQRYVSVITESSKRMAQLIDDLLSYSRLAHVDENFEAVDLNALMDQIVDDLEIPIKEKGATVEYNRLPTIKGLPVQLGQVFQNLITNSLKFSRPGIAPHVKIQCTEKSVNNKPYYKTIYTDNGIGFSQDQSKKIFDVFYRLHSKDKYEGTGVGLAIVNKIIANHGGEISAMGVPDEGATFEILFPKK